MTPPIVLSIAGSDSCSGAGIQADLKTFSYCGCHGLTTITAITAQNSQKVKAIYNLSYTKIYKQIETIAEDSSVQAFKTGMLGSKKAVEAVIDAHKTFALPSLVVDPVFIATSGDLLVSKATLRTIQNTLLPLAQVVTPNILEASVLSNHSIKSIDDMKIAAERIKQYGSQWVVIKGGDLPSNSSTNNDMVTDIIFDGTNYFEITLTKIQNKSFHGSGCSFSAAIVSYLALGYSPLVAIKMAKNTIYSFLESAYSIGKGSLILNQLKK